MGIHIIKGDLFEAQAEALVNPVNCKGVMGKGLAAAFKQRFPGNFQAYKKLCDEGALTTGVVFAYRLDVPVGPVRYVINFPTKAHWRGKSKLAYVAQGLLSLHEALEEEALRSVAIPALGCGLGGLQWEEVEALIIDTLDPLQHNTEILLYPPQ